MKTTQTTNTYWNLIMIGSIVLSIVNLTGVRAFDSTQAGITFETSLGDVVLALELEKTPLASGQFISMATAGLYDQVSFSYLGSSLRSGVQYEGPGFLFEDEIVPELTNQPGTLAIVNGSPRFFVNIENNIHLDGESTVFGHVVTGHSILEKMGAGLVRVDEVVVSREYQKWFDSYFGL